MLSGSSQWQALRLAWARLIHPRPVLVMISDDGLLFCWKKGGRWTFRSALWPDGVCHGGLPLNREAIGELIADLLFDLELPGAELVLCLPPAVATWSIVDGMFADDSKIDLQCRGELASLDLPFSLEQSYLLIMPIQNSCAVAGIPRSSLQAWIDVVEFADLPLRRVSWSLIDALRGLHHLTQAWSGDLAWLLVHDGKARLMLMRDRTPEIDHPLSSTDVDVCFSEARACVKAWQQTLDTPRTLGWWLTLDDVAPSQWSQLVDAGQGEQCLNQPLSWSPAPWRDGDEMTVLPSLAHLALNALHKEEAW